MNASDRAAASGARGLAASRAVLSAAAEYQRDGLSQYQIAVKFPRERAAGTRRLAHTRRSGA